VLLGYHRRLVLLGLELGLAWPVPVSAVVTVLVELTPCEVPAHYELGKCPLDCFGADLYALLGL
jgi:hypothetical protein